MFNVELDTKKLQKLAIQVDKILREEIQNYRMKPDFSEARIFDIFVVGVQGDERTYGHPAEITIKGPKHSDGKNYSDGDLNNFLNKLSGRITNEVRGVNKVVYVVGERDNRTNLFKSLL